jgi:hypothetical protein
MREMGEMGGRIGTIFTRGKPKEFILPFHAPRISLKITWGLISVFFVRSQPAQNYGIVVNKMSALRVLNFR